MIRFARTAVLLLTASVVLLSGCGRPSEADHKVCAGAAKLDESTGIGSGVEQREAQAILGKLSGYAPDDGRLVHAVDHARDDARPVVTRLGGRRSMANVSALDGSLRAIRTSAKTSGGDRAAAGPSHRP